MLRLLPDSELDRFIEEDCPYGDLTTHLLGSGRQRGRIVFTSREETVLCCTEEAGRLLGKCGAEVRRVEPSGTRLPAGAEFLVAEGDAAALHRGWKVSLNLLEYASGIATRTARIVAAARTVNPGIVVTTTRKSFPGTRKVATKSVAAGGAVPHRLGLSETILVFRQHTAFLGGLEPFVGMMADLRSRAPETAIMVEAENEADSLVVAAAGPDVLQIDKMPPAELAGLVPKLRALASSMRISAAGGITEVNAAEYATTGVDILVLSSAYFGRPADIGARLEPTA